MEPAIHDLTRELDAALGPHLDLRMNAAIVSGRAIPELELELELELDVELEIIDDVLMDPWFFRTEAEIAEIADDPTARVIEIRLSDYSEKLCEPRWA